VAQTRDELFEQIRRGSFELPAAAKDGREVSEKAKDLIARLLKSDPMQRYTTRETLQHPWVTGADDFAGSFNSLDTVHEMMRRFNAERRWRVCARSPRARACTQRRPRRA
jgi:serine/threonine protein kinase